MTQLSQEDGISSCSMENYKKACEAVGLVTLNSREAQKDGTFNIAAKGEGLVSETEANADTG